MHSLANCDEKVARWRIFPNQNQCLGVGTVHIFRVLNCKIQPSVDGFLLSLFFFNSEILVGNFANQMIFRIHMTRAKRSINRDYCESLCWQKGCCSDGWYRISFSYKKI